MERLFWCLVVLLVILLCLRVNSPDGLQHIGGGGGVTQPPLNARRLRLCNAGTIPVRFSKLGVYETEQDARDHKNELLARDKTRLSINTSGFATIFGSAIDFTGAYDALSGASSILMQPNDTIVVSLPVDVSFRSIRLGKFECSAPSSCRLRWETSVGDQPITTASFAPVYLTFSSGDTQTSPFLDADGSHVASDGIYTASPIPFHEVRANVASPTSQAPQGNALTIPPPPRDAAGNTTVRFLYTKGRGITEAYMERSIGNSDISNKSEVKSEVKFALVEDNTQRRNVMFTLLVDCSQLPSNNTPGTVRLAALRENEGKNPDPGIVYDPSSGEVWAVGNPDQVVSERMELSRSGKAVIAYVSNHPSAGARSSFTVNNGSYFISSNCQSNWSTGLERGVVTFHDCVQSASFFWSDSHVFSYQA